MKIFAALLFTMFSSLVSAGQTEEWMRMLEKPQFQTDKLKLGNQISKYLKYDFSTLLIPRRTFLGFIGDNYQRLNIYFTSISKSDSDESLFLVKGISLVENNKCEFKGTIKVTQIREYETLHFGVDDNFKKAGIKAQGVLIGTYRFEESKEQKHSGTFEGIAALNWVQDQYDILHYDSILSFSDRYRNNQYVGKWTEYGSDKSMVANWGEFRIPFSGDLDIGAGEFSPNPKYRKYGWRNIQLP